MPLYSGQFFESADEATAYFQYGANLRAANSRDERFSPIHRAQMQREAAAMYLAAREAHNLCGMEAFNPES